MMTRSRSGFSVAIAALSALSFGVPAAHAGSGALPSAMVKTAQPSAPTVHVTMNGHGILKTDEAFGFRPGLIRFSISGQSNCPVWFIRLHDGYSFSAFRRDLYAGGTGDLAARRRLSANSDFRGGAPGRVGQTITGSVTLPAAGEYVIASIGAHVTRPIRFELTGVPQDRAAVHADATIVATADGQWSGDFQLPTSGTLRFTNNDSEPHQLYLQPVIDGTTLQQVRDWFQANPIPGPTPPPWFLSNRQRLGMEPLDPGATETHTYSNYAPGTYLAWQELGFDLHPFSRLAIVHIGD